MLTSVDIKTVISPHSVDDFKSFRMFSSKKKKKLTLVFIALMTLSLERDRELCYLIMSIQVVKILNV